jgi:Arc/MetJ-type ribon-helix-helix transcriptional regulator
MDYATVKVPAPLVERIGRIAEANGYRSVSEFVIDSIRVRLDAITARSA